VEHPAIAQVLLEAVTLSPPAADVVWMLCRYANKRENNAKAANSANHICRVGRVVFHYPEINIK